MNRYPWLEEYLLSKPGAASEFKAEWEWLRFLIAGRQFAAICTPGPEYAAHAGRTMVLLKCDPLLSEHYRKEYADVVPGFYSDKRCWNTVYLDGAVPEEELKRMCDISYDLVFQKLTKKAQKELLGED